MGKGKEREKYYQIKPYEIADNQPFWTYKDNILGWFNLVGKTYRLIAIWVIGGRLRI